MRLQRLQRLRDTHTQDHHHPGNADTFNDAHTDIHAHAHRYTDTDILRADAHPDTMHRSLRQTLLNQYERCRESKVISIEDSPRILRIPGGHPF